jgi:hypothetical protein
MWFYGFTDVSEFGPKEGEGKEHSSAVDTCLYFKLLLLK